MTLTLTLIWCLAAILAAFVWHRIIRAQRKATPPARCQCDSCTRKTEPVGYVLTSQQLGEVQTAAFAVSAGMLPCASLAIDWAHETGVGQVVVAVVDGPTFARVVEPALRAHVGKARAT